jgi:hypothetical protein
VAAAGADASRRFRRAAQQELRGEPQAAGAQDVSRWLAAFRDLRIFVPPVSDSSVRPCPDPIGANGAIGNGEDSGQPVCSADGFGLSDWDEWAEIARTLAAAERAVASPDALEDEAEVMLRGEIA